jgi:hypothetical protein
LVPLRTSDNFPSFGLSNLFKFSETDFTNGTADTVTGQVYNFEGLPSDSNNSTTSASANGGIVMKGWKALTGPSANIVSAWTIALTGATANVANNSTSMGLFAFGDSFSRGTWWFNGLETAGQPHAVGDLHGAYGVYYQNGTQVSAGQTMKPWTARWGYTRTSFLRHDGAGNFSVMDFDGATGRSTRAGWTANAVAMATNSSSVFVSSIPVRAGAIHQNTRTGIITIDSLAVYNRYLNDDELQKVNAAGYALTLNRGRV